MIEVSYVYDGYQVAVRRFETYSRPLIGDKLKFHKRTGSDICCVVSSIREDVYLSDLSDDKDDVQFITVFLEKAQD